jgi:hypothetical protein
MDTDAGIPLMHQLIGALGKELPGLLLEQLHHRGIAIFV